MHKREADRADFAASAPPIEIYAMPGHLVRRMHQASMAIFDSELTAAGFDLTSVQYAAMTVINARPGLDQATLATAIAFDRATTGGVIDRLEAKGLVRREIDRGDRRMRRLFLQPEGRTVLVGVKPVVFHVQDVMLQGLAAAERKTFLKLLGKALRAVGDVSRAAGRDRPAARGRDVGAPTAIRHTRAARGEAQRPAGGKPTRRKT